MPNVSPEAQAKVAAVRELLKRMTVRCPDGKMRDAGEPDAEWLCPHKEHGYTGYIPDPALTGLWELVEEPCEGCLAPGDHLLACSGVVTRDWTHSLSGSLWGAVMTRIRDEDDYGEIKLGRLYLDTMERFFKLNQVVRNRDLAIMSALEAALKARLEAKGEKAE